MISEELRCIFIHIPKTGGTAVYKALAASGAGFRELVLDDFDTDKLPPCADGYSGVNRWEVNHFAARYLKPKYDGYFKFAFVRNPFDLVVSGYHWWVQNAGVDFRKLQGYIVGRMGFADYVMSPYTDYLVQVNHFGLGQSFFVLGHDNRTLCVDMVGRFERLQSDFDAACDQTGMPRIAIPLTNTTQHAPFHTYYDALTANMVKKKFMRDFQLFNYSDELALPGLDPASNWEQALTLRLQQESLLRA